jgi:hypothetical protein
MRSGSIMVVVSSSQIVTGALPWAARQTGQRQGAFFQRLSRCSSASVPRQVRTTCQPMPRQPR